MIPIDYLNHEAGLKSLGFVEGEDCVFRKGILKAIIEGRVITFSSERIDCTIFASLDYENFQPRDVMEDYYFRSGLQSVQSAYEQMEISTRNYENVQNVYANAVADYFNTCGVPVWHGELEGAPYEKGVCYFRISSESNRGVKPVDLFGLKVRHDFGTDFIFADGHIILVDGDDSVRNVGEVFNADLLEGMTPENPVERVDYSSTYHYQHIANAIPDMLRVGVKSVFFEECEIVTTLSKPISHCRKHFRPQTLGKITDYCVTFKRSIHPAKKWNEE